MMSVPCLVVDDEKLSFSKKESAPAVGIFRGYRRRRPRSKQKGNASVAGQGLCREGHKEGERCVRVRGSLIKAPRRGA